MQLLCQCVGGGGVGATMSMCGGCYLVNVCGGVCYFVNVWGGGGATLSRGLQMYQEVVPFSFSVFIFTESCKQC